MSAVDDLGAALVALGTSTVSDALDRLGIDGQCHGIRPMDPTFTLAGPAFTVRYAPCGTRNGSVGDYVDEALRLLAPSGLIGVDNALWHGWVMDESHRDADTDGMRAFNDRMAFDARIETVMLPIADGLTLIRRR